MNSKDKTSIIGGSRLRVFFYGFLIWTLWIIFYAIFFMIQIRYSWDIALIASAGTYYPFALLSIVIWIICRKIPFDKYPPIVLIFIHFLFSMFLSALWLFTSYGLWYLQEGSEIFTYLGSYSNNIGGARVVIGWQFLFGMITYLLIAGIFYTIIYYKQFREKQLQEAELKLLTRDAELKALKMQIHPHFLFNSLNSINALVTRNPKQTREMIAKLSELLRVSLESRDKMLVPLKEELEFVHLYLEIEKIRFSDRMEVEEEIDPELLDVPFPAMVLQPLLENAVIYGVSEYRGMGRIRLLMKKEDHRLCCIVTNTVAKKQTRGRSKSKGNGTGLENIRRRLNLFYSGNHDFKTGYPESGRFEVRLSIPMKLDEKQ